MIPDSRWIVMGEPATPAEQAALEAFKEQVPDDGIVTAWVNVTFLDTGGRSAEVDVLLLAKAGFFVVELKGWAGRIEGDQQTFELTRGRRTERRPNPLLLTDAKARRLATLLKQVSKGNVPFVNGLTVMHGQNSEVRLQSEAQHRTVCLDGYHVKGGLPTITQFLNTPPANPRHLIDLTMARKVRGACEAAGLRKTPKQRYVGHFLLDDSDPVESGPDWQDFLADDRNGNKRRLRVYDVPPRSSSDEKRRIEQQAYREERLTQSLKHPGIESPLLCIPTDDGPALVFEHNPRAVRLDHFLDTHKDSLTFEDRLNIVRMLGDVLHYAHDRRLVHRTLAPRHVYVVPDSSAAAPGGAAPRVRRVLVRDWYAGQRALESGRASSTQTGLTSGTDDLRGAVAQDDWLYLAPEALGGSEDLPGIPLDVYGFGALAYLTFTGEAPAKNLAELQQRLATSGALDLAAVSTTVPDSFAQVVRAATAATEHARTPSVDDVQAGLDRAWQTVREQSDTPDEHTAVEDPLDAKPGDAIAERFIVVERRGEGSTGTALLVNDTHADDPDAKVILKLANNDPAARRLDVEAQVLSGLDHPRVVKLLSGPLDVAGRRGIVLSDAGRETLSARLAKEGRATLGQLERYGEDLFESVAYLDSQGVFHRDIKPANLGVRPTGRNSTPHLFLFDLSLAREPLDNVASGTRRYLDPWLGKGNRRQYDRAAELWAVSVTLFEMATNSAVWWREGGVGPVGDEAPEILPSMFEETVAQPLAKFFARALAPQATDRYRDVTELARAWRSVFVGLAKAAGEAQADDAAAAAASVDAPIERAGFSAHALSGLRRLDVTTVGDLLKVPPFTINRIRGLGETYRKEIQRRIREWRDRLEVSTVPDGGVLARGIESLVETFLKAASAKDREYVRALLGLPDDGPSWPTGSEAASGAGLSREDGATTHTRVVKRWQKMEATDDVATDVVDIVARLGRIATLDEAAAELAGRRGAALEGDARVRHATAVVRAVYEVERLASEPRFEVQRRRVLGENALLLGLKESADPGGTGRVFLEPDLLADLAGDVGETAENLVAPDGQARRLVPAHEARTILTAKSNPDAEISPDRLVRLAAAVSPHAAVSSTDDLYAVDLPVQVAIELALRSRPGREFTPEWVRRRVEGRFPELRAVVPGHPQLDPLVEAVQPDMVWSDDRYESRDSTRRAAVSTHLATNLATVSANETVRLLRESLSRRSARTLCVPRQRYVRTVTDLLATFPEIRHVDVAREVVDAARELASERQIPWDVVLEADAAAPGTDDHEQLRILMSDAMTTRWATLMATETALLLTSAGPLVRYGLTPLLSTLLDLSVARPAARWLLVPRDSSDAVPFLEHQPVPLGADQWLDLPPDILAEGKAAMSTTSS